MPETLDLTTYNPSCLHYDEWLGVCGHQDGRLMACRERICPDKNKSTDPMNVLFKGE